MSDKHDQDPDIGLLDRIFRNEDETSASAEGPVSAAVDQDTVTAASSAAGMETAAVSPDAEAAEDAAADSAAANGTEAAPSGDAQQSGDAEVPVFLKTIPEDGLLTKVEKPAAPVISDATSDESFLESLDSMDPDDYAPKPKKEFGKELSASSLIRKLLILICIGVFAYCLYYLAVHGYYYYKSYQTYKELEELGSADMPAVPLTDTLKEAMPKNSPDYRSSLLLTNEDIEGYVIERVEPVSPSFQEMLLRLNKYRQKNSDFYGYIRIEDTSIQYQVVQCGDNDYYLDHDFIRSYDPAGAIFVDYRCGKNLKDNLNTTLYGHHMSGGSTMFHDLDKFAKKEFFDTHPYIVIETFDGIFTYEIFAVYQTDRYYGYIKPSFENERVFLDFCEEMRSNSLYQREGLLPFTGEDRILTLSTCTNVSGDGRLCVQARLIGIET